MGDNSRHAVRHLLDSCKSLGYARGEDLVQLVLASEGRQLSPRDLKADSVNRFAATNGLTRKQVLEFVNAEIAKTSPTPSAPSYDESERVPVLIVTALPLEATEVKRYLKDVREVVHPSGTVYVVGTLNLSGNRALVAVVIASDGNIAASVETERALAFFKPEVALFVGVAGGIKDDVQIGDVVVGTYVYDYSSAKEGNDFQQARIKTHNSSYAAIQRAYAVEQSNSWKAIARANSIAAAANGELRVFVKPLAAGPKLLASTSAPSAVWIRDHCGDALAVEMEGFGFLEAANAHPSVKSLVVRGISDLVDGKSSSHDALRQPMAASRAAAFALTVASELLASKSTRETTRQQKDGDRIA